MTKTAHTSRPTSMILRGRGQRILDRRRHCQQLHRGEEGRVTDAVNVSLPGHCAPADVLRWPTSSPPRNCPRASRATRHCGPPALAARSSTTATAKPLSWRASRSTRFARTAPTGSSPTVRPTPRRRTASPASRCWPTARDCTDARTRQATSSERANDSASPAPKLTLDCVGGGSAETQAAGLRAARRSTIPSVNRS